MVSEMLSVHQECEKGKVRPTLQKLFETVNDNLPKAEDNAKNVSAIAVEMSKAAGPSPSMSGDRNQVEVQAEHTIKAHDRLMLLKYELEGELEKSIPLEIRPACVVVLKFDSESAPETFVLVNNPTDVDRHISTVLISPESPLGSSLLGKEEGDSFQYEVRNNETSSTVFNGTIIKIE
jgi:hypothetical protein